MDLSFMVKSAVAIAMATALGSSNPGAATASDDRPARVEFRILADTQHDRAAADKAKEPDAVNHPPAGYRWIWLGNLVTGSSPTIAPKRVTVPGAHWEDDEFAGGTIRLTGKNLAGTDLSKDFDINSNTADTLQVRPDPMLFLKSVASFRIDLTPSRVGLSPKTDLIIRDVPEPAGRIKRLILIKLDRYNVTDKDFTRVERDRDEQGRHAIRFEFSRGAADRFGALTREHLPEAGGKFKYQMGIILDGRLLSAPVIASEIRDAGIIEGGPQGFKPKEVEIILKTLRGAKD